MNTLIEFVYFTYIYLFNLEKLTKEEETLRSSILEFEDLTKIILHTMEYWDKKNGLLVKPLPTAQAKAKKEKKVTPRKSDKKSPQKSSSPSEARMSSPRGSTSPDLDIGI